MPLTKLHIRPGVNTELTPTANEAGWSDSQLIRFFNGMAQKTGGWTHIPNIPALTGVCRGIFGWSDLQGVAHLALGSEQRLHLLTGGDLSDITPAVQTSNIAATLATTAGSAIIGITDYLYTPNPGDWLNITTTISQSGLIIQGRYQVSRVETTSSYAILAPAPATATKPAGGLLPYFTTTTGSSAVKVYLPDHGITAPGFFNVTVQTTVGGVTLLGYFPVNSVQDSATFTLSAYQIASTATSAYLNAGQMQIQYMLPSGVARTTALGGWGAGNWSAGNFGISDAGMTSSLLESARTWSLDHFGQNLIASPTGGGIYTWAPPNIAPASVLGPTAPSINKVVFSIAQAQIIMSCGSSVAGSPYPTLIRWCDSGDYTAWVASAVNQAGSYQIPTGSYITAGMAVGLGALIWTDVDLYSATYQGLPYVFGFQQLATGCEAASARAPAAVGSLVVWPSTKGFLRWEGGAVMPMECPVWDWFYNNLDMLQKDLIFAAPNSEYHEVAWFFPLQAAAGYGYVKWNYLENTWDYGTLERSAWADRSPYGPPCGTDDAGVIYQHETSPDADGAPLLNYAQTGYYDIADGELMQYVNTVIPDFVASVGTSVEVTIYATDYPNDPPRVYGPFTVTSASKRINCNIRGRQVAFRFGSTDKGSFWRAGAVRYLPQQAGRRP